MRFNTYTVSLSLAALVLTACGGGQNDIVLPVTDNGPQAYTDTYLAAHPEVLIQPEHLLIVHLDPARPDGGIVRVRVSVREPLSLQMGPPVPGAASKVLGELMIQDSAGALRFDYHDGDASTLVTLDLGKYTIIFIPRPDAETSAAVFVKLADTPAQLARQRQLVPPGLLGVGATLGSTKFGENCRNCVFDNADLTSANFHLSDLSYSTFHNARMDNVDFSGAYCISCALTADGVTQLTISNSNFDAADLDGATLDQPSYTTDSFRGASFGHATVNGLFIACDFGLYADPYTTPARTNLAYADLRGAKFDGDNNFASAVFTGATVGLDTFQLDLSSPGALRTAFSRAIFDGMTPGTVFADASLHFAGYDLSGTSFGGIDLSSQDLSAAAGVTISATTDFSHAILSDGYRGVSLAGQSFPTGYAGLAGTVADPSSGRDLRFVNFSNVSLAQADFTRARLDGATMVGIDLTYANLYHASLVGAQLGVAPGTGTQAAARLNNAFMPGANFSDADLRSVSLSGVHMYGDGATFERARLDGASLDGAFLMQAAFVSASLNDANLAGAALVGATFDNAVLSNAKLDGAYLQGTNFATAASVVGADLTNAVISTSDGTWQFVEVDGTPMSFAYSGTALSLIAATSDAVCPSGDPGPCTGAKLVPIKAPPYPVRPACIPLRMWQYKNCEAGWTPPSS
jgi:uncharacterized protein YjbI with pentapeptide repeats